MKVAFTHNLRLTNSEEEAEFDTAETVDAIASAIEASGHDVDKIEVSGSAATLLERLEAADPDIIFNTAEGARGRTREAFYPTLFEELGVPYTGSDPYTLTLTLDKWLCNLVLAKHGVDTPRSRRVTEAGYASAVDSGIGLAFPVIVKPNYEGSSKGIGSDSVAQNADQLQRLLRAELRAYPDGILVEEFIPGIDISMGYVDGVGHDGGLLLPVEHLVEPSAENPYNVYDYRLKILEPGTVKFRCPAEIPRDVSARLRTVSKNVLLALGINDLARIDFRIGENDRIYVLEVNALPSLERGSSIFAATAQHQLSHEKTVAAILNASAIRQGVATAGELGMRRRRRRGRTIKVGFTYNVKREHNTDEHAEFDPPATIIAIANALAQQGHIVVHLEATPDLPRVLAEADVDLIFNIAEGVEGRNREAQVPALCELLGIPYTGSDSATLAIALDKALAKKVLMQHDILTPNFQVMETGREKLSSELTFPLILKPNAEGSSKGIGSTNVVDNQDGLREAVRALIERYKQPVIVEEYITGREFTVGLLGDKRPRVLPPMEIRFKDEHSERPVYNYDVKQEWEKHVSYECPAKLSPAELKAMEKIARETFWALDCRDVGRVDLRMADDGRIYVLEVNPLPGLTPDYSDLVLIGKAIGMDYDDLIAEVMIGGLRRLREKWREEREVEREAAGHERKTQHGSRKSAPKDKAKKEKPAEKKRRATSNGNGNETAASESAQTAESESAETAASAASESAETAAVESAAAETAETAAVESIH